MDYNNFVGNFFRNGAPKGVKTVVEKPRDDMPLRKAKRSLLCSKIRKTKGAPMPARAQSRYELGLLILLLAEFYPQIRVTSALIGDITGYNPVIVRETYRKLKAAGLLDVKPGPGGLNLARDAHDITLWDVYNAVDDTSIAALFGISEGIKTAGSDIGPGIHSLIMDELETARENLKNQLADISLYDFAWRLPDTYKEPPDQKLGFIEKNLQELEERFKDSKPFE
jgi:DNA-binding IscR family transcriptional regulator